MPTFDCTVCHEEVPTQFANESIMGELCDNCFVLHFGDERPIPRALHGIFDPLAGDEHMIQVLGQEGLLGEAGVRMGERFNIEVPDIQEEIISEKREDMATKYRSKTAGKKITSTRPFGIELEINLNNSGQNALRGLISREFQLVHDGSVNSGIEVVSPILQGGAGEKEVHAICEAIHAVKAGADESCGYHVHLDASDFFPESPVRIMRYAEVLTLMKKPEGAKFQYQLIHSSVLKDLKNVQDGELINAISNSRRLDRFQYAEWNAYTNGLNQYSAVDTVAVEGLDNFQVIASSGSRGSRIPISDLKKMEQIKGYAGEIALYSRDFAILAMLHPVTCKGELVIVRPLQIGKENALAMDRLKRVASFYSAFDDVVASTLPCDRRDNDFTKRLSSYLSLGEISRMRNILDFFKTWTQTRDLSGFRRAMQEGRHASRYHGINFTSLLKHGTIEIRYHGGTTNVDKILHWIILHQAILDCSADMGNKKFNIERLDKASMIIDRGVKTDLFFSKLDLPEETEVYLRGRIEKFGGEDKNIAGALLEQDNKK